MKCARHVHGTFISRHLGVEWVVYAGNRLFHRAVCSRHMFCQMHLFVCSYKCIMMLTNAINRLQIDLSRRWIDDCSMPQRWISVDSTPLQRWVPLLTRCDIIWDEAFLKWNWALFLTLYSNVLVSLCGITDQRLKMMHSRWLVFCRPLQRRRFNVVLVTCCVSFSTNMIMLNLLL